MTDSDYISRLLVAERAEAPPSGSTEVGLQRLLGTIATHAAPLPVAVGSLKLGLAVIAKWVGVGFVVGTLGAGAASYAAHPATSTTVLTAPAPKLAVTLPLGAPVPSGPGVMVTTAVPTLRCQLPSGTPIGSAS